jgi:hypothetical protein
VVVASPNVGGEPEDAMMMMMMMSMARVDEDEMVQVDAEQVRMLTKQYLHWGRRHVTLLFREWAPHSRLTYALSLAAVLILALFYEWFAELQRRSLAALNASLMSSGHLVHQLQYCIDDDHGLASTSTRTSRGKLGFCCCSNRHQLSSSSMPRDRTMSMQIMRPRYLLPIDLDLWLVILVAAGVSVTVTVAHMGKIYDLDLWLVISCRCWCVCDSN